MLDRTMFRDAMARLGAAVSVVTTIGGEGVRGMTASAICSVTDDPPTLLLCINRDAELHDAFKANGVLCVNTLAASQEALSPLFAGLSGDADRATSGRWSTLVTGSPVLEGALVAFDCRVGSTTDIGTHTVFFCEVLAVRQGAEPVGLIYFARAYHRVVEAVI